LAAGLHPDPLGKLTCSPNPKLDFLGRDGRGEKSEKRDKRRERGGRKREGAATGILQEGRHVAKYGTAGEYCLG